MVGEIDLEADILNVQYDAGQSSLEVIQQTIRDTGFEPEVVNEGDPGE